MNTEGSGDDLAPNRRQTLLDRLSALGECDSDAEWLDYSAAGIGPEQIPDLIEIALTYTPDVASEDDRVIWAPVHALRALGQLHAAEAIGPLMALFRWVDDDDDDWLIDELPTVFAMFGPAAIPVLRKYLHDAQNPLYARSTAATGLQLIGTGNPSVRDEVVAIISEQLRKFSDNDPGLNGLLISRLLDLKAVEAAPVMEQAFVADSVETFIAGEWQDVQVELGLLPARKARPERPGWFTSYLRESVRPAVTPESEPGPTVVQANPNSRQARRKAEREEAKKKQAGSEEPRLDG